MSDLSRADELGDDELLEEWFRNNPRRSKSIVDQDKVLDEILLELGLALHPAAYMTAEHDKSLKARDRAKAKLKALLVDARLSEAKSFEVATAKKFDELCERVRNEPSFGNTTKHKKDNFLDGAESMTLLPSIRRAELEALLNKDKEKM